MADRKMTNEEAIEILVGIWARYNFFDECDKPKYAALSKAIFALKAEPTKHGHWIDGAICSVCGELATALEARYCENCGARMDEVEE